MTNPWQMIPLSVQVKPLFLIWSTAAIKTGQSPQAMTRMVATVLLLGQIQGLGTRAET